MGAAVLGFVVTLVMTVRARVVELAVLRALGSSRLEILRAMLLEWGVVLLLGTATGVLLGRQIARLTLQFLEVTEDGERVVPGFVLATEWGLLGVGLAVLTGVAVLVLWSSWRIVLRRANAAAAAPHAVAARARSVARGEAESLLDARRDQQHARRFAVLEPHDHEVAGAEGARERPDAEQSRRCAVLDPRPPLARASRAHYEERGRAASIVSAAVEPLSAGSGTVEPMADVVSLSPQRLGRIRSLLLAWYDKQGEPFPWRDARNPYWALVAGVCSQQTPMSRVHPLWQRWIEAFPTVDAAARAERAQALRGWGDAGYPRRAVHLHEAAHRCEAEHGGRVPSDEAALLALPGVGPFTAAIVRSFGYGEDAPAVDTNVVRVIGRLVHGDLQPARETPPRGPRRERAAAAAARHRGALEPRADGPRRAGLPPAPALRGLRRGRPLRGAPPLRCRPTGGAASRAAAVRRLRPPVAGTDPRGPAARRGPAAHGAAGPRARPQRRGADNGATPARRPLRGGTRLAARRKLRPRGGAERRFC